MENTYGYARCSTKDQNLDRQMDALHGFGIAYEKIYKEKQSGRDFQRPEYQRLLLQLKPGDALVVKSIDRLGRNYEEILEQWRHITKKIGADIVVLDMPLLDTRHSRDLTGRLIADIVLELLSYVAQVERELIKQRQAEGIASAKARGKKFGAPPKERTMQFTTFRIAWEQNEISARTAAKALCIATSTFLSWCREENAGIFFQNGERKS